MQPSAGGNSFRNKINGFGRRQPVLGAIIAIVAGLVIACCAFGFIAQALSYLPGHGGNSSASTENAAQYRHDASPITVSNLAKDPNAYKGRNVTFQAVILNFIQDSSGNTNGANVSDPNGNFSVVQIIFSPSLSVQKVNQGDTITVWGQVAGTFAETNAFGATIHEGVVQESYLDDSTANYSDYSAHRPATDSSAFEQWRRYTRDRDPATLSYRIRRECCSQRA
jgi:hypothetical protein